MIVVQATQVLPGASLRAHVSKATKKNPPPVELSAASPQPVPTIVTQKSALSPPGIKDPPAGAAKRYWYVLSLPLAGMFTGWAGRPEKI